MPAIRERTVARGRGVRIVLYPWPDLGVPRDPRRFKRALKWLLEQASAARRVEIGCAGGHGQTGSTLAGLFLLQGFSPQEAIRRVRRAYCDEAIESAPQEAMIRQLAR